MMNMMMPGILFPMGFRPSFPGLSGLNWIILPLLVVVFLVFFRIYRGDGRELTGRQRLLLWALRTAVAVIILLTLLKPSFQLVRYEERMPVVAILMDESSSMNFPAGRGNALLQMSSRDQRKRYNGAIEAAQILQEQLSLTHRVKIFSFSDTLTLSKDIPIRDKDAPFLSKQDLMKDLKLPTGDYTEGGDAILYTMDRLASNRISSIVMLSDGRNTGGETLEKAGEQAAQLNVPIHAITFGSEDPLRDLRIDNMDSPSEASLGDILMFQLEITNYIQANLKIDIKLFEQNELDSTRTVRLKKGKNIVRLSTIPRTEGLREYRVELPRQEDEMDYDNNKATVFVNVVKKTLRVLFVAGRPTREYQHIILCLLRDPIIRVSCFLQSANVDYVQQGNFVIDRLPRTNAEWQDYDVVLLYDVDPKELSTQQVSGIENTVNKGAGLILMTGRNYGLGQLLQIHANKMRQMLPVDIDKNRPTQHEKLFKRKFRAERTPEARYHAIFRLVADEKLNELIWSTFPDMYWRSPVLRIKSKAIVAMKVTSGSDIGDRGDCLMAIQRFGEGVSIYLGTDEIWRWRYPYGAYDYDLFWTHITRYLGETRLLGAQKQVSLSTNKQIYSPGEKVWVKLQILDYALLQQLEGETISAIITDSMKARHMIPMVPDLKGRPFYLGSFQCRHVGPHVAEVNHHLSTADTEAKDLFNVKGSFKVEIRSLEVLDTRANLEGMQKIAEKTSGKYFDYRTMTREGIKKLAESIPAEKLRIPHESLEEVWDTWFIIIMLLILLAAEWSLRKLWGLL